MHIYTYSGIAALLFSSLFATLSCCFRLTGDAGISRLIDKNPNSENLIEKWKKRWNILLLSIRACLGLSEIIAIYCTVHLSHDMKLSELEL